MRKFRRERLQSRIWEKANIWSYLMRPLIILNMTLQPLLSEFPFLWRKFNFLFCQCLVIAQSFLKNKGSGGVLKNFTEKSTNYLEDLYYRADTKQKWNVGNINVYLQNENPLQKGSRYLDSCLQCDKKQIIFNAKIANKSKILKNLRGSVCRVCKNMCTRIPKYYLIHIS
jgi:hypothetical protein